MNPNDHNNNIQPIHTLEELQKKSQLEYSNPQMAPKKISVENPTFDPNIKQAEHKRTILRKIKDNIKVITYSVIALAAIFLVLTWVITPIQVNGISMQPTFHTGDFVLVYKWPQTWAQITHTQYIPERGQVVIINDTNNSGEEFIKRVIGLPDDSVTVKNGIVNIQNPEHQNGFNPDKTYPYGKTLSLYQPDMNFSGNINNGEIFVMGDNRLPGASIDSRSSIGNIPSSYIVGRVLVKVWPLSQLKLF